MAFTPKDNTGTLFRNDKREKDSHPNAKGTAIIDGVEYWISAWTKSGAKGNFQSLSFQRKDQQQSSNAPRQTKANFSSDLDDEIPFAPEFR